MAGRRRIELVAASTLSPSVRGFRWRCVDGAPLAFVAGQWVNFHVPVGGELVRRAYSIASAPDPDAPAEFDIAVTRVETGQASLVLHALAPGACLEMDGAHGFFTREGALDAPAFFVGTGTGVCPLRSMIEDALRPSSGPALRLLFGCRSEADLLYREDFDRWARDHDRFDWHFTLSRPPEGWTGRRGYVQTHLAEVLGEGERPHAYVCGLQHMIREVRKVLKEELGYDRKHIHSERYD